MNKALSSKDILSKKYKLIDFKGAFYEAFSKPEANGTWFIWGNSGNGKTNFILQLIKELVKFDTVLYDSLEEGIGYSLQQAWRRNKMDECGRSVKLISEPMHLLIERLERRKSPNIIVIDSFQYLSMGFSEYMKLKNRFPRKLFIYNSQAIGKNPLGKSAVRVMYDANLKIWVEGYKAFSKGRYIGKNGGEYIIWERGANEYWETKV